MNLVIIGLIAGGAFYFLTRGNGGRVPPPPPVGANAPPTTISANEQRAGSQDAQNLIALAGDVFGMVRDIYNNLDSGHNDNGDESISGNHSDGE